MQFCDQPLPLGRVPVGCRITFRSVHYCAEVFYPLSYTLSFWPFSFHSDSVPFSFMLPSLVLEVSTRFDFRTLVQETNLNCASKPSRFAGTELRQSQLSWRAVFSSWEGRTEVQSWQLPGAQQGRAATLSLSSPWATTSPVPAQCVWMHPLVTGDKFPGTCWGKGRMYARPYLFYFLLRYQRLMVVFFASAIHWVSLFPFICSVIPVENGSTEIQVDVVNSGSPQGLAANQHSFYDVASTWQKESSIRYSGLGTQTFYCLARAWICFLFCLLCCFLIQVFIGRAKP